MLNDDLILVIGGQDDEDSSSKCEIFKISTKSSFNISDLPEPCHNGCACLIGNKVIYVGLNIESDFVFFSLDFDKQIKQNIFNLDKITEHRWYKIKDANQDRLLKTKMDGESIDLDTSIETTHLLKNTEYSKNLRKKYKQEQVIFVVIGVAEKRVAVIVDQLIGQQEIIVKPIDRMLGKLHGIAGGCVLSNGRVALVLDQCWCSIMLRLYQRYLRQINLFFLRNFFLFKIF